VNLFDLTPTCNNKTSNHVGGFIQPPLRPWGGTSTSAGGFSFGIFAPIGAIQPKEVAIAKAGRILRLHSSEIAFQFLFQKELIL
jgi:hypothetical protein